MQEVSDRWEDALGGSHQMITKVSMVGSGEQVPITGGSVTLDITAAIRGRVEFTLSDPSWIPLEADSLLAPYGNEVQVERGLRYIDGTEELVPLGIYRIETSQVRSAPDGPVISVTGQDRAARIIDAVFEEVYTVTGGTDFQDAVLAIVEAAWPDVEHDFEERSVLTPTLSAEQGEDRWTFAQTMSAALGMDLYFNNAGVLVMRTIPEVNSKPVAHIHEGEHGVQVSPPAMLLDVEKLWTRENAHNKWIVVGDNADSSGAPPTGTAIDDDPNSPTYYFGPFGKKPEVYHSSFIATDDQASDAAGGKKSREAGTSQEVDFGSIVNPALEPADTIHMDRTIQDPIRLTEIGWIEELHIIDSLTIPLTAEANMTGHTRSRLIV